MSIEITIEKEKVKLVLKKGKEILDAVNFPEKNNLSEKLLLTIDKLLKKNKIKTEDIKSIKVKTNGPVSFTTERIARAVAKAYNFAVPRPHPAKREALRAGVDNL